jgi:hypothetical protein
VANPQVRPWPGYWIWPSNPPDLLTTTLAGGPAPSPFAQTDWPNPASIRRPSQPDVPPNLLTTLYVTPSPPFTQTNWPNPLLVRQLAQADAPPNLLVKGLAPVFSQSDWSNPILARQPGPPDGPPNLLDRGLARTFSQQDWPNPSQARQPVQPDALPNLLTTVLYVAPAPPFSQTSWINPVLARYPTQPEPIPNLLTGVFYVVPSPPFYQTNWPLPLQPRYPIQPEPPPDLLTSVFYVAPATISVVPASIQNNQAGVVLTVTGVSTIWTIITPIFSFSGVAGLSITSTTVLSDTSATITVNSGSATGTATLTETTSGASCPLGVVSSSPIGGGGGAVPAGSSGFSVQIGGVDRNPLTRRPIAAKKVIGGGDFFLDAGCGVQCSTPLLELVAAQGAELNFHTGVSVRRHDQTAKIRRDDEDFLLALGGLEESVLVELFSE